MPRTRQSIVWFGRIALLTGSALACWALLEVLVLPLLIHEAPIDRQRHFTPEMQILAQDTKPGLVPENYVLIVGDSYAKGYGDWLLSVDYSGHPPFHSAHVIHEETGREVLSFGQGGASNVAGLVLRPRHFVRALARFGLEPPERVVVYFYAGNDLRGNLQFLSRSVKRGQADLQRIHDTVYIDAFLQTAAARQEVWWRRWWGTIFTPRVAGNLVQGLRNVATPAAQTFGTRPRRVEVDEVKPPGETTQARIAGQLEWLPDRLQSPAMVLPDEQFEHGLLVLDRALASLRELYPEPPILLVYVPSVLECYEITSPTVSISSRKPRVKVEPTSFLESRSAELPRRVAEIARRQGFEFLDPTPALRSAAAQEMIHGPRDWNHFNERGYRILGREIAESGFIPTEDALNRASP